MMECSLAGQKKEKSILTKIMAKYRVNGYSIRLKSRFTASENPEDFDINITY
jgi:hypothetical protein